MNAEIPTADASDGASKAELHDIAQSEHQFFAESDHAVSNPLWTPNIAPAEIILPTREAFNPNSLAPDLNFTADSQIRGTVLNELSSLEAHQEQQNPAQEQQQEQETRSFSLESQIPPVPTAIANEIEEFVETQNNQEAVSQSIDPELGRLRLRETQRVEPQSTDPELGRLRLRERQLAEQQASDPELGEFQLRERELAERRPEQSVFFQGRIDYFRSNNILLDDVDPVDDQLITVGISVLGVPSIGPRTNLVASVGASLARYGDLSELNYNNLQFRLGVRHNLFPNTYGELSWTNQQLFSADDGDQFLNDHSIRLSLWRRDQLAPRLNLDSFYQFRLSFADPADRSRLVNTLGIYLSYEIQRDLEAGLDYQFVLTNFTQQEREDSYHQLTAQLSYNLSRKTSISLYGGFSFGRSSESSIDFDSSILGISLSTSI
ncbi:hypothetical protein [Leptolyngbya sp. FACHB-711]|nr:hypothetical protein [Leptolyngbya sp. FACHB-711]